MAAVLEAKAVILGEDKSGAAFKSLRDHVAQVGKVVGDVERSIKSLGSVGRTVDSVAGRVGDIDKSFGRIEGMRKFAAGIDDISRRIAAVDRAGQSMAADRARQLAQEAERIIQASAKLGEFRNRQVSFAGARSGFNEARVEVERLARQIAAAEKPTRALEQAFKRAQLAVAAAAKTFDAEKGAILSAKADFESLAGPIDSVAAAEERLRAAAVGTSEAMAQQGRMAVRASEEAAAAMRRQEQAAVVLQQRQQRGHALRGMIDNMLPFEGPEILHLTKEAFMAGAELRHVEVGMEQAGIGRGEIEAARARALELSAKYGNISQTHLLDLYKETRSVMTSPQEAMDILGPLAAAKSILDARDTSGKSSEGLTFLVKGAENIGAAKDPDRLKKLIDGYVKAIQVMGKTVSPEAIFEFDKRAKSAGARLSDRFLMTTAQSLSQEMGGDTAGNAVNMFAKQLTGGFQNSHGALKEFVRLGLIKHSDVDWLKNGEAKQLKPGIKPAWLDKAASDPDLFVWENFVPAMVGKGITSLNDQLTEVRRSFPNSSEADLVSKLITQRTSYEAHAQMYGTASGLAGADMNRDDPIAGLAALGTQIQTFAGVVTSPIMKDAAHVLYSIADEISSLGLHLEAFNKANPGWGKAIGGAALAGGTIGGGLLTWKLFSGLGSVISGGAALDGAAGSLTGAAGELTAAAWALRAGGAAPAAASAGLASLATLAGSTEGFWTRLTGAAPGALGRLVGVLGPILALRDIGEMMNPTTPWGAPYRFDLLPDWPLKMEQSHRAEQDWRRDPEAARGREMMRRDADDPYFHVGLDPKGPRIVIEGAKDPFAANIHPSAKHPNITVIEGTPERHDYDPQTGPHDRDDNYASDVRILRHRAEEAPEAHMPDLGAMIQELFGFGGAHAAPAPEQKLVTLDPNSKALIELVMRVDEGGLIKLIQQSVKTVSSGNIQANVGVTKSPSSFGHQ